jgi:multidrug resistance efflux pump
MSKLEPIPSPPRRRLQIFCAEKLPFIIFGVGVIAAVLLWQHSVAPTLVAEAESIATEVRAAQPGALAALEVTLLQQVKAGQVVARVRQADPQVLASTLAMIRAEIDLMKSNLEPVLSAQRVALDAGRLQLDWMHERVTLASLRIQLQQANDELSRLTPLHNQKIISDEAFDTARHERENVSARLGEQTKLVETLTPAANEFVNRSPELTPRPAAETLAAAIRVQEGKLRLTEAQLGVVELTAPISGVVSVVHRRAGEVVQAGEPIVTVAADQPARIVGFLRQPLQLQPKPGMAVEIRTRGYGRQLATARIVEVGRVMEPVSPTLLALVNRANSPELGLRIHIAIPESLHLRPGEQVDVTVRN